MTSYKDKDVIVVEEKCNIYTVCQMEYGLFKIIMDYLNVRELLMVTESCLTKQLSQNNNNLLYWLYGKHLIINTKKLFNLYCRYKSEFPQGKHYRDRVPTPFVCACELGRMDIW